MTRPKRLYLRTLLLLASGCLAFAAQAQDVRSWGKATMQAYGACAFVGTAAQVMGAVGPREIAEARECVDSKLLQVKEGFQTLPPQKKPAATAALRDYYAAWIAAMKAVPSLLAQPARSSDVATAEARRRLNELWARFEIES